MKATIWLTLTRTGVSKINLKKPALGRGQRAIRLSIQVPDVAFEDKPPLDAELVVPLSHVEHPPPEPVAVELWEP